MHKIRFLNFGLGACFATAFAPLNAWYLAWPALGYFYHHIKQVPLKSAWVNSLCFALGFNLIAHSWVYNSIYTYGGLNLVLSLICTLGFLLYLSLAHASLLAMLQHPKLIRLRQASPALLFTTLWICFEKLKLTPLICFPWSQLGYSLSASPFKYLLPLTGILGSGALTLFIICLCADLFHKKSYTKLLLVVALYGALSAYAQQIEWSHPEGKPIRYAAIQGNFPEFEKWDPDNLPTMIEHYGATTLKHLDADLVIWPEGAMPMPWQHIRETLQPLLDIVKSNHKSLIIGTSELAQDDLLHNSMVIQDETLQFYRKENLVYFGESLPLRRWLQPIIDWLQVPQPIFTYPDEPNVIPKIQGSAFTPLICYDVAFHSTIQKSQPQSRFLITLSDDAWFGHSFALAQHLQIAASQALVFARPHIVATNSGLTAQLDPHGHVIATLPAFKRATLQGSLQGFEGSTVASKLNDFIILVILALTMLVMCIWHRLYK